MSTGSAPELPVARVDLASELLDAVQAVGEALGGDRLAFLAATRKFEDPVRDIIAWKLNERLTPLGLIVSREFPFGSGSRADIAILDKTIPAAIIELKALYAFDIHSKLSRAKYQGKVAADLERTAKQAPHAQAYAIALTTHIVGEIPPQLERVVKYARDIQRANRRYEDAGQLRVAALPIWSAAMGSLGAPVGYAELGSGRAWNLQVTVDAWLVGPVPTDDLTATAAI